MKRLIYPLVFIILVWLPACVTPHGTSQVKPISPAAGDPHLPKKVDSLQPTLQWKPPPAPGTSYDLVIYEGIKITSFWKGTKRSIGRQVYYRQGISTSSHRVEEPLKPGTEYYWTVRVRRDGIVSEWAKYDYFNYWAYFWDPLYYFGPDIEPPPKPKKERALLFMFKTPKQ